MALEAFLAKHRADIIERCRVKVRARRAPRATAEELERGIPLFLDQLIETLRLRLAKNEDPDGVATRHGGDLLGQGFTVAQVVHDYGDVCQAVTDLAIELNAQISNEDFRTLNRCLDDAIADAVTEFSRLRDVTTASETNERLGLFAHEVRNLVSSASLAAELLKSGRIGAGGATGAILERSLSRISALVARSLAEVRLEAGKLHRERIEVRLLLEEVEIDASVSAKPKGIMLTIPPVEGNLVVEGDPQILSAVLVNLVQNAIKFTQPRSHVTVNVSATTERVQIDVADECGGLPPLADGTLFHPFEQRGHDRSGVGLGLIVARRGAEAHGGTIQVRDIPGTGCVFSLDLPRSS
jgi:signal transduction histidine kinase